MFKRIVLLLLVFILMLSVASMLSACNSGHSDDADNIPPLTATKLRKEYQKYLEETQPTGEWDLADIWVQRYFGKFSGCEIVYMGSKLDYEEEETTIEIAGYLVKFPNTQPVYAYNDDAFFELKDAYESGLITAEDVRVVKQKVSGWEDVQATEDAEDDAEDAVDTEEAEDTKDAEDTEEVEDAKETEDAQEDAD